MGGDSNQQSLGDVTKPEPKPLVPTRYVEDDKLTAAEEQSIKQILDLFESLSWFGRKEAIRRINRWYQEQHRCELRITI